MHSNVTIKNVSWPHFSWATLYVIFCIRMAFDIIYSLVYCEVPLSTGGVVP